MSYTPAASKVLYPTSTAADVSGYKRLVPPPVETGTETSAAATVTNAAEGLIEEFISPPCAIESLAAGDWVFRVYASVDNAADVCQVKVYVYKRNFAGTETELFNATSAEINDLSAALTTITSTQSAIDVDPTDRIVIKFYAVTSAATNRTVTLYRLGETHYTRIELPFDFPVSDGDMHAVVYDAGYTGVVSYADAIDGVAAAGNSKYYGTDSAGTAGFYSLPSGGTGGGSSVLEVQIFS